MVAFPGCRGCRQPLADAPGVRGEEGPPERVLNRPLVSRRVPDATVACTNNEVNTISAPSTSDAKPRTVNSVDQVARQRFACAIASVGRPRSLAGLGARDRSKGDEDRQRPSRGGRDQLVNADA
jgi:hypothetical protein